MHNTNRPYKKKKESQRQPTRLGDLSYYIYRELARERIDPMKPFLTSMPTAMLQMIDIFDGTMTDDMIVVAEALYGAYITLTQKRPPDEDDQAHTPEAAKAILVYASLERLKRDGMISGYDIQEGSPYDPDTNITTLTKDGKIYTATLAQYKERVTAARKPATRRPRRN